MINRHVKRCSTSFVIKGMYTKTTKRNSETTVTCQPARKLLQSSCITSERHRASFYQPKWATWTPTRIRITKHSNPNMFKSTNSKWLLKKKKKNWTYRKRIRFVVTRTGRWGKGESFESNQKSQTSSYKEELRT